MPHFSIKWEGVCAIGSIVRADVLKDTNALVDLANQIVIANGDVTEELYKKFMISMVRRTSIKHKHVSTNF